MGAAKLAMTDRMLADIRHHLFGSGGPEEQGGFLLCKGTVAFDTFEATVWLPLCRDDYVEQAEDYLELTDAARARVIKAAHDHGGCLVELHSHPSSRPACFSLADLAGLREFVPHVRWRLNGKPYLALVFGTTSFDGLAWVGGAKRAVAVGELITSTGPIAATGLTARIYGEFEHA